MAAQQARDIIRTIVRREPLVVRFAIRQKKRRRDFGGLELSVDNVSIRHGRELAGELKELEVEYKSGRRSGLAASPSSSREAVWPRPNRAAR
jgi:hypothetical protein